MLVQWIRLLLMLLLLRMLTKVMVMTSRIARIGAINILFTGLQSQCYLSCVFLSKLSSVMHIIFQLYCSNVKVCYKVYVLNEVMRQDHFLLCCFSVDWFCWYLIWYVIQSDV